MAAFSLGFLNKELGIVKYKTFFAVALLLGTASVAAAVPDQPFMQAARADLQTASVNCSAPQLTKVVIEPQRLRW